MLASWLLNAITQRWPDTGGYPGWATRSQADPSLFVPVGIINHHTAPPVPFPLSKLETKCNVTILPNGRVVVMAAGYQWDSGLGAPAILDAIIHDRPLPSLTGLRSTMNGNPFFFDIEVQHLGDGGPLAAVQRKALLEVNAAICEELDWDPSTRVIGHREWAPDRKVDPRWDGFDNPMPGIRRDTRDIVEDDMSARHWTLETWKVLVAEGLISGDPAYYASGAASPTEYRHAENVYIQNQARHTHKVNITQDITGEAV
jgi:hypothetical protein